MTNKTLSPRWQAYQLIDRYYRGEFAEDLKNVICQWPSFDCAKNVGLVLKISKAKVYRDKLQQLHNIRQYESKIMGGEVI